MAKKPRKGQRAKVPITRHPLFPAIVALWFAALLGLGSLAIRPSLIESVVLATHIDLLIPAAAPPLGITARIVLALALAIGGGLLGASIGNWIARPKVEARPLRRSGARMKDSLRAQETQDAGPARRPISAHEEIGESAIAASGGGLVFGGRRRALAIEEDDDEFRMYESAPLPDGQPPVFDAAEAHPVTVSSEAPQELDLGGFEPLPAAAAPEVAEPAFDAGARQVFQPAEPAAFEPAPAEPEPAAIEAAAPNPYAHFAPPVAPPIDFSRPQEVAVAAIGAEPLDFSPPNAQAARAHEPAPAAEPTAPLQGADAVVAALDDLGLIELTERFAQTLRRRREKLGDLAGPEQPVAEPAPAVPQTPEPEVALSLPAAMRPLDLEAFDDEDEDLSSLLPLRKFAPPSEAAVAEPAPVDIPQFAQPAAFEAPVGTAEDAEAVNEAAFEAEGYSSLLDLVKQPAQSPQFVRIEEPDPADEAIEPVVVFPGQTARLGLDPAPEQPAPFAAPAAPVIPAQAEAPAPAASPLRPFDSPDSARPGQAVAATAATPAQDPAETERALRAALATLQRMSGAA